MTRHELLALRHELEALTIDFWYDVDHHGGLNAAAFYVQDAVFETSIREYRGRDAVDAFYARRRQRGARLSLHIVQNFRIEPLSDTQVRCVYVLSVHAADGEPVLPSRPAIMVAMADELVARQPDGAWLYQSRRLKALFRDDTPTTG